MELVIIPDGLRFRGWLDDDWEVSHRDICDCNLIINYHFEIIFGAHDSKIGSTILYNIEVVYCNLKLLDESQCFFYFSEYGFLSQTMIIFTRSFTLFGPSHAGNCVIFWFLFVFLYVSGIISLLVCRFFIQVHKK